jgi:hypothetical protein
MAIPFRVGDLEPAAVGAIDGFNALEGRIAPLFAPREAHLKPGVAPAPRRYNRLHLAADRQRRGALQSRR